jgi:amino-acid N-acetyltransferase
VNTQLVIPSSPTRRPAERRRRPPQATARVVFRAGTSADARRLFRLIDAHTTEGHLLPRREDDLAINAPRFVVAERRGTIIGCAELAPLSGRVAEVRSLVVDGSARGLGIGRALVGELEGRARREGFESLCAFTHDAGFFVRGGFSLVPHSWVPEKIAHDCVRCPQFRRCGQHAVVFSLGGAARAASDAFVPLASLRS